MVPVRRSARSDDEPRGVHRFARLEHVLRAEDVHAVREILGRARRSPHDGGEVDHGVDAVLPEQILQIRVADVALLVDDTVELVGRIGVDPVERDQRGELVPALRQGRDTKATDVAGRPGHEDRGARAHQAPGS